MDRRKAKECLLNGDYVLRDVQGKADFWKVYKRLYTKDGKETNCVQCKNCLRFDEYDTNKGLKTLNNHVKSCNAVRMPTLDRFVQRDIKLTTTEKNELTKAAAKFCYTDMRPFVAIEGKGLNHLLEAVSALSAKYGKFTSEQLAEMLPVANTVNIISIH